MCGRYMVGPGGEGHCTKMNCPKEAVIEVTVSIFHPGRKPYDVTYPFCAGHREDWGDTLHKYPNFTIVKEIAL